MAFYRLSVAGSCAPATVPSGSARYKITYIPRTALSVPSNSLFLSFLFRHPTIVCQTSWVLVIMAFSTSSFSTIFARDDFVPAEVPRAALIVSTILSMVAISLLVVFICESNSEHALALHRRCD